MRRGGARGLWAFPLDGSRRFIRASARKLKELCERPLQGYDFVGLVLDGKRFEDDLMVIALGITVQGEKVGGVCSDRDRERAGVDGVFAGVGGAGAAL